MICFWPIAANIYILQKCYAIFKINGEEATNNAGINERLKAPAAALTETIKRYANDILCPTKAMRLIAIRPPDAVDGP